MSEYEFFLSYARDDRLNDPYGTVDRFYDALAAEIRLRRGPAGRIGFFDTRDIEQGASWPDELVDALQGCRAFVPIVSPTYFVREYCGKEWAAFEARLDAHVRASGGQRPPLIHPVLLLRRDAIKPVPPAIAETFARLQTDNDAYPRIYSAEGLQFMVKLTQYKDDVAQLVTRFAERLVATIDAHQLGVSDTPVDLRDVASAFHDGVGRPLAAPSTGAVGRSAQFVYVAGRRSELRALKQDLDRYGDEGGMDWLPYHPTATDEVGIIAQEVASKGKLRYEAIPADATLPARLREAEQQRKIVAVIADLWTLRLDSYRELLAEFDERNLPNCVVVVPWNLEDPETAANAQNLQAALELTFARRTAMAQTGWLYDGIRSLDELRDELSKALAGAQMRLIRVEEVRRRADGAGDGSAPVIVGPGGAV